MTIENSYKSDPERETDFQQLVELYYAPLYQFALSLTRAEPDACDLVQDTFSIWAFKGHQLRDGSKVKTWLFTTLHRRFLETQRRSTRFRHFEIEAVQAELPQVTHELVNRMDSEALLSLLAQINPLFQAPVALFYLEDYSYNEIGEILQIPLGTVKSRIARGLTELKAGFLSAPMSAERERELL